MVTQTADPSSTGNEEAKTAVDTEQTSAKKHKVRIRVRNILRPTKPSRPICEKQSDERNDASEASAEPSDMTTARENNVSETQNSNNTKTSSLFGGLRDKRQQKVVFSKFSQDPRKVIRVEVDEIPEPTTDNDVIIKVTASTVSLFDCNVRKGVSYETVDLPVTPGADVVGNIIKRGKDVKSFQVGERVAGLVRFGGNARYINVSASDLVQVPRSCDASEAVCMVSTYMSAYQALRMVTDESFSLDGKSILITGGIEPVGQALVQLCVRAGASEVYATAPELRHKYVEGVLGVSPLPMDPESWSPTIKEKMHFIFDVNSQFPFTALREDGVLVSFGEAAVMNRDSPGFLGTPISAYWAKFVGAVHPNTKVYDIWDSFSRDKDAFNMDLEILFHLLKKRFIKPHIAKRISLSEVVESHVDLENEAPRGQIICLPWKRNASGGKSK